MGFQNSGLCCTHPVQHTRLLPQRPLVVPAERRIPTSDNFPNPIVCTSVNNAHLLCTVLQWLFPADPDNWCNKNHSGCNRSLKTRPPLNPKDVDILRLLHSTSDHCWNKLLVMIGNGRNLQCICAPSCRLYPRVLIMYDIDFPFLAPVISNIMEKWVALPGS